MTAIWLRAAEGERRDPQPFPERLAKHDRVRRRRLRPLDRGGGDHHALAYDRTPTGAAARAADFDGWCEVQLCVSALASRHQR